MRAANPHPLDCTCLVVEPNGSCPRHGIPVYLRRQPEPRFHSDEAHQLREIVQRMTWHQANVNVPADLLRRVFARLTALENVT